MKLRYLTLPSLYHLCGGHHAAWHSCPFVFVLLLCPLKQSPNPSISHFSYNTSTGSPHHTCSPLELQHSLQLARLDFIKPISDYVLYNDSLRNHTNPSHWALGKSNPNSPCCLIWSKHDAPDWVAFIFSCCDWPALLDHLNPFFLPHKAMANLDQISSSRLGILCEHVRLIIVVKVQENSSRPFLCCCTNRATHLAHWAISELSVWHDYGCCEDWPDFGTRYKYAVTEQTEHHVRFTGQ